MYKDFPFLHVVQYVYVVYMRSVISHATVCTLINVDQHVYAVVMLIMPLLIVHEYNMSDNIIISSMMKQVHVS